MDGMVGQVQNCLFCQTPSVIKCGISLVSSGYRDLINHYAGPTGEGRILI